MNPWSPKKAEPDNGYLGPFTTNRFVLSLTQNRRLLRLAASQNAVHPMIPRTAEKDCLINILPAISQHPPYISAKSKSKKNENETSKETSKTKIQIPTTFGKPERKAFVWKYTENLPPLKPIADPLKEASVLVVVFKKKKKEKSPCKGDWLLSRACSISHP